MRAAALLCLLLSLPALAEKENLPGLDAYRRGDFQKAAKELQPAADSQKLSDNARAKARMYLAAAYFALGDMASAKANLRELARQYPNVRMDPTVFDPDLVQLANKMHDEVDAERKADAEKDKAVAKTDEGNEAKAADQKLNAQAQPELKKEVPPPEEPKPEAPSAVSFRIGVAGILDVASTPKSGTGVASASVVISDHLEAGVRVLPGASFGAGAEVGYLFGDWVAVPRVGVRATKYFGTPVLAVGPVVGVRVPVASMLALTADAAYEANLGANDSFTASSVTLSAGLQLRIPPL